MAGVKRGKGRGNLGAWSRAEAGGGEGEGALLRVPKAGALGALQGGSEGILPQKFFKLGGSETLFSALAMRHVSEKSTPNMKMANNCKSL